ncbi:hypothetical protein PsorP6_009489 [Peronosclerospora sorghi]|uniref:Uncharacterized protein n=1 Tax=Peronosclerospora sorghi TaxID=230839 RepID=A0ACC0VYJ0_9STRA|nr:hypothetical protein PsorP6_009489 [Peronosclerospora sorghi]
MQNLWREFKQHENLQEELATLDHLAPNLQDLLLSRFFAFIQQDQVRLANWMQWQKLIAHASAQKHEQAMVHATTATAEIHPSGDIEGVLLTLWKEFTQPMLLLEGATPPRSESEVHMFLAFVREDQNRLKLLQSWIEWRETSTGKEATVDDVYTALVHATTN